MSKKEKTAPEFFRENRLIFLALFFAQIIFAFIALFIVQTGDSVDATQDLKDVFMIAVPIFIGAAMITGPVVFGIRLKHIMRMEDLTRKMPNYRIALMIRWAIFQTASFFGIIVFLTTGEWIHIILAVIVMIAFLMSMPNKDKAIKDLELSANEQQKLNDPNEIIAIMDN